MNFREFANGKAQQPLPPSLDSHEAELSHFGVLCHELCIKLLRLFALGLRVCKFVHPLKISCLTGLRSIQMKVERIGFPAGTIPPRVLLAAYFVCVSTLYESFLPFLGCASQTRLKDRINVIRQKNADSKMM